MCGRYHFVKEHFAVAVRERDVHLVGEYVECAPTSKRRERFAILVSVF